MLDLRHGLVTDDGAQALAACPDLKNLDHLDLSWNRLDRRPASRRLQATGDAARLTAAQQTARRPTPWETFDHGDIE